MGLTGYNSTALLPLQVELLSYCVFVSAVGRVLHTLPEGNDVWGVTSLDNLLYVIREKASQQISVYDTDSYRLQRRINVPQLRCVVDMAACAHYYCLYVSDQNNTCIHRTALPDHDVTKWPVHSKPSRLSVSETHSVLVMCEDVKQIKEFTTRGKLLRQVQLHWSIMSLKQAIQLSSGDFIVCHGRPSDPVHRVCLVDSGGQVVKSYGGPQGASYQQMDSPTHMAVDRNGFVFVADLNNSRVLLLSPALTYVREVVSLEWGPRRLFLDDDRRRLYVAANKWDGDECTAGRVVVINV